MYPIQLHQDLLLLAWLCFVPLPCLTTTCSSHVSSVALSLMEPRAMAVPVLRAGKHLAKMSGWTYSNLEMQKILYISHMVYLGQLHEPLIEGHFEAWDYGPVHPELYYHLSSYGAKSVPESAFEDIEDLNKVAHRKEME